MLTGANASGIVFYMSKDTRVSASFTLDQPLLAYIKKTKGKHSASERLNQLLRRAMIQELYEELGREAAEFYATEPEASRAENRAWQNVSRRSVARD